jgi:hypothetical protein
MNICFISLWQFYCFLYLNLVYFTHYNKWNYILFHKLFLVFKKFIKINISKIIFLINKKEDDKIIVAATIKQIKHTVILFRYTHIENPL